MGRSCGSSGGGSDVEKKPGLPDFYATGLAKALVGDQPCLFEPWMKGHYTFDKASRSSNLAQWKLDHTAQLHAEVERLKGDGWKTTVEKYFRLTGQTAIIVGKPDVIAQAENKRPKIVDVKSGKPRDSDVAQVLIYMVVIPMVWKAPHMIFEGEVVYSGGGLTHRVKIDAREADAMRARLFPLVRRLAVNEVAPDPAPGESNCRFCDVTKADCPTRFEQTDEVPFLTSEF